MEKNKAPEIVKRPLTASKVETALVPFGVSQSSDFYICRTIDAAHVLWRDKNELLTY